MDSTKNGDPVEVASTVALESIDSSGRSATLAVELRYDPNDPYAMSLRSVDQQVDSAWTFARDLLIDGVYAPTGDGDVHVFPSLEASGLVVVFIELTSPDGCALLKVRSRDVAEFVDRMCAVVPRGEESRHLDLDDVLAELLAWGED